MFLPLFEGPLQLDLRLLQNTDRAALLLIPFAHEKDFMRVLDSVGSSPLERFVSRIS
jgi:hypothetical protein